MLDGPAGRRRHVAHRIAEPEHDLGHRAIDQIPERASERCDLQRQGCVLWLEGARTAAPTKAVTRLANDRPAVMLSPTATSPARHNTCGQTHHYSGSVLKSRC